MKLAWKLRGDKWWLSHFARDLKQFCLCIQLKQIACLKSWRGLPRVWCQRRKDSTLWTWSQGMETAEPPWPGGLKVRVHRSLPCELQANSSDMQQHFWTDKSVQTSEQSVRLSVGVGVQTVLWVLKYTVCVIVYCDVVNVQPCFNFFDEIIK